MGCDGGGGVGWKVVEMFLFVDVGIVVGINGVGFVFVVMFVISGVVVAVIVIAEFLEGVVDVWGGFMEVKGVMGGVIFLIMGVFWIWGVSEGIVGGVFVGVVKGVFTGYVLVVVGEVDGKLVLNGFIVGEVVVVLRFNVVIFDFRFVNSYLILKK